MFKRSYLAAVFTLVAPLGFAPLVAVAQDGDDVKNKEIEEVNVVGRLSRYSALKADTPIMELARSVSIIDQESLRQKGVYRLDQAYAYAPGVLGETFGFATRGDWVRVRGFDVPQYQDSLQSLFGNYNNTRPDVYTLEQVEILKGPASVLYGQGSPGGLVNVVSKRPQEKSRHELVAEIGNFDRRQFAVDSTGAIDSDGEWLYRAVGVYRDTETQVNFVDDKTTVIAPSLTWRPSEMTNITLLLNYTDTESDTGAQFLPILGTLTAAPNGEFIDTSVYAGEPDFNKYDATTTSVTLLADHQLNDVWSFEITSRYTDAEADYQQAWSSFQVGTNRYIFNPDGSLYDGGKVPRSFFRSDATSEQTAFDGRLRAEFDTGEISHNVLMGAQYQNVTTSDAGYYAFAVGYDFATQGPDATFGDSYWINLFSPEYGNVPPAALLDTLYAKNPDTDLVDTGIYISDHMSIGALNATVGVRYDDASSETSGVKQDDDEFSLSAGLLYKTAIGLAPYISYAESFQPVVGSNGNAENPQNLKPQEGEQIEVGIKYQANEFPAAFTLSAFDIEQSNLSDPSALPGDFEQQRGKAKVKGVEFEGTLRFDDVGINVNLSKLDTENAEGFRIASVAEKQASTWLSYEPESGFRSGIGARYVGDSWGGLDRVKTPSYTLVDLMLGYAIPHWNFSLNVRNAADKEYQSTCLARGDCFPGRERTVVGRIAYDF